MRHKPQTRRSVGRPVDEVARAERRELILGAARACFIQEGFQGASVSSIAKGAGVSVANLYQYFKSKEDIILAIVEDNLQSDLTLIKSILEAEQFIDGLDKALRSAVDSGENDALRLQILAEGSRNSYVARRIAVAEGKAVAALSQVIKDASAREKIASDFDPEKLASLLLCFVEGWFGRKTIGLVDFENHRDTILQFISYALGIDSPRNEDKSRVTDASDGTPPPKT